MKSTRPELVMHGNRLMAADITRCLSEQEVLGPLRHVLCLYIKDTGTIKGRGVFAGRRFAKGEIVEIAPVIVFNACELPRILANVVYHWEQQTKEPKTRAIALGYGSMYNHDNPSSLSYTANAKERVICYTAARDIARDEELTINYSAARGQCDAAEDQWFEWQGIARCPPA
jgi:uncharacterized protein